jgi:hypothetical protein
MGLGNAIAYPIAKALYVALGDGEILALAALAMLGLLYLIVRFMRKRRSAPRS